MKQEIIIYSDGGARGNPGPAGIGAVISDFSGKELVRISKFIGVSTNNQAEYLAVIEALKWVEFHYKNTADVKVFVDSELVCRQIQGIYKVKNEGLKPLFIEVQSIIKQIGRIEITSIPREKNKIADKLVNIAIDGAQ